MKGTNTWSAHKYLCKQVVATFESNLWLTNELRTLECSRTHECQTFVSRPSIQLSNNQLTGEQLNDSVVTIDENAPVDEPMQYLN